MLRTVIPVLRRGRPQDLGERIRFPCRGHYRSFGDFAATALPWLAVTLAGFGTGAIMHRRDGLFGRAVCAVLSVVAIALAIFPTFMIYSLQRWLALCLLFVSVSRAPLMRTRRDLYFTLMTCFAAATVTAIHSRANWLLWVYLGPACLFAGLALTMEHVATHAIGVATKLAASAAFMGTVVFLASLLFLWLPRPPILGFGFLPPPSVDPGLLRLPAGTDAQTQGGDAGPSQSPAPAGATAAGGGRPWRDMVEGMRGDLRDPSIPGWQRGLLERLLDAMKSLSGAEPLNERGHGARMASSSTGTSMQSESRVRVTLTIHLWSLLAWLAAVVLAALCWWRRHALAFVALNAAAWALTRVHPQGSMKLSALMMAIGLQRLGSPRHRGQTLREQLALARGLPGVARHWYGEALDLYYAARFGRLVASARHSHSMRLHTLDATDLSIDVAADRSHASLRATLRRAP